MSQLRLRRLQSDHEAVRRLAHLHPRIEVEGTIGTPPERYRLKLLVKSLRQIGDAIEVVDEHRLEITIPGEYPRVSPVFRMLTPVFHPNIAPHAVCIGDHWSAAESLDLMIQRVGEMLGFQSYNIKSPLNGRAAQWVDENLDRLPIDPQEFLIDLGREVPTDSGTAPGTDRCSNCGAGSPNLASCAREYSLCDDCVAHCDCGELLCLVCGISECDACKPAACSNCGRRVELAQTCAEGHGLCTECASACERCGRPLCLTCGEYPCRVCDEVREASP